MKISPSSGINTYKQIGLLKRCLEQRKTVAILEIGGKVVSGVLCRRVKPPEVTRYLSKIGGKFDHDSCCHCNVHRAFS